MAPSTLVTEGMGGHRGTSCLEFIPIRIDSIFIDLDSADKTDENNKGEFSIRGYVAKVKKKDGRNCFPFAWDNDKINEVVPVLDTSTSEPSPNIKNDINVLNNSNEDSVNISLRSTNNSALNDLLGEGVTDSQDLEEKGIPMPTLSTTLNDRGVMYIPTGLSDSDKCPTLDAYLREDDQEQENGICYHPKVPCLVYKDLDSSQQKGQHPSVSQSCSLLVDTDSNVQSARTKPNSGNKIRKIRTRLLSELLNETGNGGVAATGPKSSEVAGTDRNVGKKLLNDEEWRPHKINRKKVLNKKKVSKRRKSYTHPNNLQQNIGKICNNSAPDDVPMEIVELMAKNQYERSSKNHTENTEVCDRRNTALRLSPEGGIPDQVIFKNCFDNTTEENEYALYSQLSRGPGVSMVGNMDASAMFSMDKKKYYGSEVNTTSLLHIRSNNGTKSRNLWNLAAPPMCKEGDNDDGFQKFSPLEPFYSNHVVPATHLLSLMEEGSSRFYSQLSSSSKEVFQFGFGLDNDLSFSPLDKYNGGGGRGDVRKTHELFPPTPFPLAHSPQQQSKNGGIHSSEELQKTGFDMKRRGREILTFPQNVSPKGHCTTPSLSHIYDDGKFGGGAMECLDLELGFDGGTSSSFGRRKMACHNTEPCNVNRNPSDFSAPSGKNTYMIGKEDVIKTKKKGRFFYDACIQ